MSTASGQQCCSLQGEVVQSFMAAEQYIGSWFDLGRKVLQKGNYALLSKEQPALHSSCIHSSPQDPIWDARCLLGMWIYVSVTTIISITFCNHLPKQILAKYVNCSHQNTNYSYINVVDLTMYFDQEYGFVHIFANTVISTIREEWLSLSYMYFILSQH